MNDFDCGFLGIGAYAELLMEELFLSVLDCSSVVSVANITANLPLALQAVGDVIYNEQAYWN